MKELLITWILVKLFKIVTRKIISKRVFSEKNLKPILNIVGIKKPKIFRS